MIVRPVLWGGRRYLKQLLKLLRLFWRMSKAQKFMLASNARDRLSTECVEVLKITQTNVSRAG